MKLIAHRGGAGLRIENTLAAFEHAIDLGADGAELDVHSSRDGQVVVHHDDRLNDSYCRHIDGDWIADDERLALSDLSYEQMQAYEIGAPRPGTDYARRFDRIEPVAGQRIPLLRDVVRLARQRSAHFFLLIEIKASLLDGALERLESLVDATLAIIEQEDFADRTILCSFDWRTMLHAKKQRPDIPTWFISSPLSWFGDSNPPADDLPPNATQLQTIRAHYAAGETPWFAGFDPRQFGGSYPQAVAAARGDAWYPFHSDCTQASCRESRQLGLDTAAWTVNLRNQQALRRVAQSGVSNLTTDYPDSRPKTAESSA